MLSSALDVLAWRQVDFKLCPLVGAELPEATVEDRFRGRDELQHDRLAVGEVFLDRRDDGWQLQA